MKLTLILLCILVFMVSYPCSVCRATFDSPQGLSNHKCSKCAQKEAGSITSLIEKRRQDRERQLAAKVQGLDDEDATIRAWEAIRQQSAEAPDDNEIPVCLRLHSFRPVIYHLILGFPGANPATPSSHIWITELCSSTAQMLPGHPPSITCPSPTTTGAYCFSPTIFAHWHSITFSDTTAVIQHTT